MAGKDLSHTRTSSLTTEFVLRLTQNVQRLSVLPRLVKVCSDKMIVTVAVVGFFCTTHPNAYRSHQYFLPMRVANAVDEAAARLEFASGASRLEKDHQMAVIVVQQR